VLVATTWQWWRGAMMVAARVGGEVENEKEEE